MATNEDKNNKSQMEDEEPKVESSGKRKRSLCAAFCSMLKLTKEGATPVNWRVVMLVVFTLFGSCYSITFLFPFLPEMILWFGYSEEDKGHYAGIIASAMFAGRATGSYFWGWLSDRVGRRPVVLVSLVGVVASEIGFGFSTGLVFAFVMRFITGLFNGLVGVCKTVLYEISDNTNQAVGMSCIGFAWGSGVIIGPLVSGYLANPAVRYPATFSQDGFFGRFPFMLPSLLAAIIGAVVLIVDIFIFPETLQSKIKKVDQPAESDNKDNEEGADAERDAIPLAETKSTASPRPKRAQLLRPDSVDVCASMASIDMQLVTPVCHLSTPKRTNPLFKRAFSEGTDRRQTNALHKTQSTEILSTVDEKGEDLKNYPLKKRRTSVSMQHIPSSSLLKELDVTDAHRENIEEEEKANGGHEEEKSQRDNVPSNKDSYVKSATECDESHNEKAVMLSENDDVIIKDAATQNGSAVPQVSIVVPETEEDVSATKTKTAGCLKKLKNLLVFQLLRIVDVRYTVMLYTVFSFAVIGLEEVFAVYASTEVELGGLAFSSEKIGAVIGFPSIPLMFLQVIIYPKVAGAIGNIRTFLLFNTYLILSTPLLPTLRALHDKHTALWGILIVMQGIQKICFTSCFTSSSILINNSVEPAKAGTVNGLSMTLTGVARTLGPLAGGSIFSWSLSRGRHIGFPFDVNFIFILFALVFLASNILTVFMPRTLEKQKKPQK